MIATEPTSCKGHYQEPFHIATTALAALISAHQCSSVSCTGTPSLAPASQKRYEGTPPRGLRCTSTVASALSSMRAIGVPTTLLRPITTALLPLGSQPIVLRSSITPLGVHGSAFGLRPLLSRASAKVTRQGKTRHDKRMRRHLIARSPILMG